LVKYSLQIIQKSVAHLSKWKTDFGWFGCAGPGSKDSVMGIPFFRARGVEPPTTRQLELQTAWDKGRILWLVLS